MHTPEDSLPTDSYPKLAMGFRDVSEYRKEEAEVLWFLLSLLQPLNPSYTGINR